MGSGGWSLSSGMSLAAAFQSASVWCIETQGSHGTVASAILLNPALWASGLSGRRGSRLETLTSAGKSTCVRALRKAAVKAVSC